MCAEARQERAGAEGGCARSRPWQQVPRMLGALWALDTDYAG